MSKTPERGFTLVELAIVMTIIGLLIGGVLKGQQLIQNAKVTRQIKQFEAIDASTLLFRDQYGAIPGDMVNATARITGCTAANFCGNGNGNSIIGQPTAGFRPAQYKLTSQPEIETAYYWKHMAMANMITGVSPNANPADGYWGESYPSGAMAGGLVIGYNNSAANSPNTSETGHFIMLSNEGTDLSNDGIDGNLAAMLDRRIDDGMPNTGSLVAEHVGNRCKSSEAPAGIYTPTANASRCILWYKTSF